MAFSRDTSRGEGHDLMTKEKWGMVSGHLKTTGREARSSKDNAEQVNDGGSGGLWGRGRPKWTSREPSLVSD